MSTLGYIWLKFQEMNNTFVCQLVSRQHKVDLTPQISWLLFYTSSLSWTLKKVPLSPGLFQVFLCGFNSYMSYIIHSYNWLYTLKPYLWSNMNGSVLTFGSPTLSHFTYQALPVVNIQHWNAGNGPGDEVTTKILHLSHFPDCNG